MRIGDVKRLTAQFYGLSRADMESRSRLLAIVWPRQVAMALCRHYTRCSLPQIGRAFNRDHTTVIHAIHQVNKAAQDPIHSVDLSRLRDQIKSGIVSETSAWTPLWQSQFHAKRVQDLTAERELHRRLTQYARSAGMHSNQATLDQL